MLNIIAGTLSVGVTPSTNSYESIATVSVGSGGAASVEFTGIASTYKHLQVRYIARSDAAVSGTGLILKPNNDSGSYNSHGLVGTGASVLAGDNPADGIFTFNVIPGASVSASIFGVGCVDLLDYENANKFKTQRLLGGWDNNGGGQVALNSQVWQSTTAISSLYFTLLGGNFVQYTQFALYGIKGV